MGGGGYGSWVTVGMVVGWCGGRCGVAWGVVAWGMVVGGRVLVERDIFEKET